MRGTRALALVLALAAQMALAEGPALSLRPLARPVIGAVTPEALIEPVLAQALRPRARPASLGASLPPDPVSPVTATVLRPLPRPDGLAASAEMASAVPVEPEPAPGDRKKKREKASRKGSVCGDPAIKGEKLAPIKGKVKGCGLEAPVRVTSIDGIRLNQPATISCETADAMKQWIRQAMIPAMGNRDVVEIRIAASYVCRSRNNVKGAKISEHGRGKALDVAGFVFADGKEWSVARDYNKQIRKAHKGACGIFGTTLGPGSDGYHEDHLHFDIARYSSGSYCR